MQMNICEEFANLNEVFVNFREQFAKLKKVFLQATVRMFGRSVCILWITSVVYIM